MNSSNHFCIVFGFPSQEQMPSEQCEGGIEAVDTPMSRSNRAGINSIL